MTGDSNDAIERREVYFSGRVQGVGFRFTTRHVAARFDATGFVQNLRDGRVLLVVEGRRSTLERLIAVIAEEMDRYIENAQTNVLPASGEFASFEIRH